MMYYIQSTTSQLHMDEGMNDADTTLVDDNLDTKTLNSK